MALLAMTAVSSAQSDATLSNLVPSAGTLDPAFSSGTIGYTATVPYATANVTLTPTATDPVLPTITINGATVASGVASAPLPLSVGPNIITTEVVSQDSSTTIIYTLTVTRTAPSANADLSGFVPNAGTLAPVFASGTVDYTATVPFATASMRVTPTSADTLSTITVNGTTVASGSLSSAIPLGVGDTAITTVVTPEDPLALPKTYTLTVTRTAPSTNADLSGLVPNAGTLAPVFDSGTVDYTATVPFSIASMRVTPTSADTLATITVNGSTVASGSLSSAIPLGVGDTVITTVVTPEDPLTLPKTYTLTVTRIAASTNADLSDLVSSVGALTPTFDSGTLAYTASVPYPASSITVTPTAADPLATIKVKGVTVASGSDSGPISLIPGANIINTVVTAENASTKTYTITVTVTVADPVAIPGGPYTVFAGGTLVLNGSPSLPSDGFAITTYEWDLDNDGDYDEAITGANPAAISEAVLTSTYAMSLGGNTIKLRVTDSAAKTSVVEATVNILAAVAVVYEPFNYSGTGLSGRSGTSEVGVTGTWTASADSFLGPNRSYGPLVTRGAGIGDLQGGVNRFGGARAVSPSALAGNGLLADGATMWISLIMGYDPNPNNCRLAFAFANSSLNTANFNYSILNELPQLGSGVGVSLSGNSLGVVQATQFRDPSFGSGFASNVLGAASGTLITSGVSRLIVCKITWGAGATDKIDIYAPDANLNLGSIVSTLTCNVDQSTFDTITWARGDKMVLDEIRFGGSYQAVIETGSAWDLNGDSIGASGPSPSATWNADAIWNLAPDGSLVPIPWQPGAVAVFSAGNDATGPYTVTVDGTQDISGLLLEDGIVTLSGGTALRMTGNTTVAVGPGLTGTIETPLTEDAPGRQFVKANSGTLVLSGDNSAATSGMNLSAGATRFESPAAINGTARNVTISTNGALAFGASFGAANIPDALLNRVVTTSTGAVAADNYDSTNFDFSAPGLTAAYLGAVGNVTYTGTLTQSGSAYRLGGGGGTLTMANTNALTGANTLTVKGNVILEGNNDYTGVTTINPSSNLTIQGSSTSSGVTLNTPSTTLTLGNNASLGLGTLTVANSFAGPGTLAAIGTVVTTNPVLANTDFNFGGTGALTIGAVTVGGARTITNNNITDVSTITSITSSAASSLAFAGNGSTTVTGVIGGGLGITTLTKSGSGALTLSGANTLTGAITVSGGTLKVGNAAALGFGFRQTTTTPGTTVSSGFTLDLNGTADVAEPITISGTGVGANGALVNNSGTPASFSNGISGATVAATGSGSGYSTPPTVAIVGTGTGATATASLGLRAASFTVNVTGNRVYTVNPIVTITGGGGSGATATPVLTAGIVTGINITAAGTGYTTAPTATVSGGTSAGTTTTTFTGNATNFCVGGLTMTAAGSGYTGTPTFTFDGVSQTATATRSSVALGAASSIGGSGDMTINAVISGAQALTKVGAGTVTLAGINTYSGAAGTTISAGTLKLGENNALPATAVSIGAGTLDAATFTDTTIGTLAVTGGATINLDSGAALAFASGSPAWTGTLNITGTFVPGASLRFGTTNSGLTPAQLALISKPGGGALDLDANGYLVEATGFASWKTTNGASGQTLAQDHDGDGVSNGIEYFIGGPTGNTTGFTALPGVVDTAGVLSVTWVKAASYTGVYPTDFVVETSDTLTGIWSPETLAPAGTVTDSATQATYTFPTPLGAKRFARLRVTGP
jgi:autotransporter-associated beta strand protein